MEDVPPDPDARSFGCNAVSLLILAIVVAFFAAAAWFLWPSSPPEPLNSGVPPVRPD